MDMRRASGFEKIVAAFVESVAAGAFEEAEGWFSAARANADRQPDLVGEGARARPSEDRAQPI